ncbi:hypothetical protein CA13_05810 [Planctomycetes bacterium CA13]|uniref:Uncharacterized protein n=1 Tax=Novipirellula herctigrandis TaxID=2527986 RepID=A0A5C5YXA5_9BACT|nr:hypothetical protein CA13_05810 [Planctomycetes bacterium CA13]
MPGGVQISTNEFQFPNPTDHNTPRSNWRTRIGVTDLLPEVAFMRHTEIPSEMRFKS